MAGEIHKDDIGTVFLATIKDENDRAVDISNATTMKLNFKLPNSDTLLEKNASFYTNGSDGKIRYTATTGDLSAIGIWEMQGFIITTSGQWHSEIVTFKVFPNIGDL